MEQPNPQGSAERDLESDAAVDKMLQTPWEKVYEVTHNGEIFKRPAALGGVPVSKISETDPYWEQSWQSLDEFLAQEPDEEKLKENYHERLRRLPGDKALAAKAKFHMDNVSKHRKIREIFGNGSPYHPNQLASKHHLPPIGLCQKEIMYKLACKVSDLRELYNRQELSMDPWDFLRWRITVIYKICDDSGNEQAQKYEDRLLRMAVLRSAQYRDKLANYGSKNVTKPGVGSKKPSSRVQKTASRIQQPARREPARPASQLRRERQERPASATGYSGVNGFREEQKLRAAQSNTTSSKEK
ncbi:hypothetical protein AK830_g10164 [Neonectria ditissima]|uniref:Uncharacterized protein n=1 Tax=Neonectria ditissima TaxID=78410 RepID=A0A0P7B7P1_9HYPO|nr:hypothetical protein AK830_g10164 [Neonectria ditissima]